MAVFWPILAIIGQYLTKSDRFDRNSSRNDTKMTVFLVFFNTRLRDFPTGMDRVSGEIIAKVKNRDTVAILTISIRN